MGGFRSFAARFAKVSHPRRICRAWHHPRRQHPSDCGPRQNGGIGQFTTLPCDLFLGVPKNRAADVVVAAGLTENGWVPVDSYTLRTKFDDVYAVGDLANTGVPKAGVYAEGAAHTVATNIISRL